MNPHHGPDEHHVEVLRGTEEAQIMTQITGSNPNHGMEEMSVPFCPACIQDLMEKAWAQHGPFYLMLHTLHFGTGVPLSFWALGELSTQPTGDGMWEAGPAAGMGG